MAHASLSQDGFQCKGFWEVGRTILWAGVSSFLLAPPRSSQLVFSGSTLFVTRTSSCETTQASSYHCAWPRRAVLVSRSLTTWPSFGSAIRIADPWSPSSSNEENSINSKLTAHICKSSAMEYGSEQPFSWCSVAKSCLTLCDPMDCRTPGFPVLHHLLEFAQTHVHWVNYAIQQSHPVTLFSCPQSFPASRYFLMSQLFTSGGLSIKALASASVLRKNIQGWFSLELTDLICLQSKGLSRVFSSTTIQNHQFFSTQSYGPTFTFVHDYWKNHNFDYIDLCQQSDVSCF